jgi:hypothetical protein
LVIFPSAKGVYHFGNVWAERGASMSRLFGADCLSGWGVLALSHGRLGGKLVSLGDKIDPGLKKV